MLGRVDSPSKPTPNRTHSARASVSSAASTVRRRVSPLLMHTAAQTLSPVGWGGVVGGDAVTGGLKAAGLNPKRQAAGAAATRHSGGRPLLEPLDRAGHVDAVAAPHGRILGVAAEGELAFYSVEWYFGKR